MKAVATASWLWMLVMATTTAAPAKADKTDVEVANGMVEWVRGKGGLVHPQVQVRRSDPSDPDSPLGIFATADIAAGETVLDIPPTCTIDVEDTTCEAYVENLRQERQLGAKSELAPYLEYLFHPRVKMIPPSLWSPQGQALFGRNVGIELDYPEMTELPDDIEECFEAGDDLHAECFLVANQRTLIDTMTPILDMIAQRNGKWTNVRADLKEEEDDDDEDDEPPDEHVVVTTTRAVKAGEQLYQQFRVDTVQDSMQLHGYIPDYPRTWLLESSQIPDELVDLDKVEGEEYLQFFWTEGKEDLWADQLTLLFAIAHLERLVDMKDDVYKTLPTLPNAQERHVTRKFYEGLIEFINATELALREHLAPEPVCEVGSDPSCENNYDDLEDINEHVDFSVISCNGEKEEYQLIDNYDSFYQNVEFCKYGNDTCLQMGDDIHECVTLRPHYHEFLVQYPARFLDDVKRIAIVGGGDSKILYESLKYPNLELVVHLELDQMVSRRSLKYFGTDPNYHNDKVEWWYADAGQSILMLPQEYYGTFDLVVVDTTKEVIDIVPVAKNRTIMDATRLLVKPDGIISRNMDHEWGSNDPIARHMLDVYLPNLEIFCHNSFSYASENIDFMKKKPKDHNVETFLMKDTVDVSEDPYLYWHNYYKRDDVAESKCNLWAAKNLRKKGTLMVLETEQVSFDLSSQGSVEKEVSKVIGEVGLTLKTTHRVEGNEGMTYFVCEEGIIYLQTWPSEKYCAFDIYMWSEIPKQLVLKKALVASLGSTTQSSFRIVTSGVFDGSAALPWENEACPEYEEPTFGKPLEESVVTRVLSETVALVQKEKATLYVLCGTSAESCSTVNTIKKASPGSNVVPIWSPCSSGDATSLPACEAKLFNVVNDLVKEHGKIEGLFFDEKAQKAVGQCLHQIASIPKNVRNFFSPNMVAVAPLRDAKAEQWKVALLDRLRSGVFFVSPAFRTSLSFENDQSILELGLFAAGDFNFFHHLTSFIESVEKSTGLNTDVWSVKNGVNRYIAEHHGTHSATHETYARKENLDLFQNQKSFGTQYVTQFQSVNKRNLSMEDFVNKMKAMLGEVVLASDPVDMQSYQGTGSSSAFTVVASWSKGHSILFYDGQDGLTLSQVFLSDDNQMTVHEKFGADMDLQITLHESFPRGTGRVVNFASDLKGGFIPEWAESLL